MSLDGNIIYYKYSTMLYNAALCCTTILYCAVLLYCTTCTACTISPTLLYFATLFFFIHYAIPLLYCTYYTIQRIPCNATPLHTIQHYSTLHNITLHCTKALDCDRMKVTAVLCKS